MKAESIICTFLFVLMTFFCNSYPSANAGSSAYPPGFYEDDTLPDHTVYLTFDDGPSEWTDEILNILKRENVKGTFFICGDWAPHSTRVDNDFKKYKTTLLRMIKEGNSLGNHTIDHKDLARLTPDEIARELDENQALLAKELGKDSVKLTLIRPPFGSPWFDNYSEAEKIKVGDVIRSRGAIIMWSRHFDSGDSKDWVKGDWYKDAPKVNIDDTEFTKRMHLIYERIITRANGKGIVILFHDTHLTTREILPVIIEKLKKSGYRFDTAEDLIKWKFNKSSSDLIHSGPLIP